MFLTPYTHLTWAYQLHYHLCFRTYRRQEFFSKETTTLAETFNWLYGVYGYHSLEFAIDQATILPDHVHLIVRITPKMSIEECTLLLMNNGQHFIGKVCPERLIEAGINQLWQPSAYAGTCGELPTAPLKSFLRSKD